MKALLWIVGTLVLAMTVLTIVVGARTFEGTVVDKPYETGLAYDAERRNHAELGWTATLSRVEYRVGGNDILVEAFDRDRRPLAGAEVTVRVSRPSTSAYDRSYKARPLGDGAYVATADLPLRGAWDIDISVSAAGRSSSFAETVHAQ